MSELHQESRNLISLVLFFVVPCCGNGKKMAHFLVASSHFHSFNYSFMFPFSTSGKYFTAHFHFSVSFAKLHLADILPLCRVPSDTSQKCTVPSAPPVAKDLPSMWTLIPRTPEWVLPPSTAVTLGPEWCAAIDLTACPPCRIYRLELLCVWATVGILGMGVLPRASGCVVL